MSLAKRIHQEALRHRTRGHDVESATCAISGLVVPACRQHAPAGRDQRFAPVPRRGGQTKCAVDFSLHALKRKLRRDLPH